MAGHTLVETARDALFLANIPVSQLPLVTIAVALLALVVSRGPSGVDHRRALAVLQSIAAIGTGFLWFLVTAKFEWSYYALYVWSGVITTLIVVRFWLLLGDLFTITQGKRLYAAIGMGGSLGALAGSGIAALLAPKMGGEGLLIASTAAFAISVLGPAVGMRDPTHAQSTATESGAVAQGSLSSTLRRVARNPYACRVALMIMIGGVTLTLGDFLFKTVLTQTVKPDELATYISQIYLGLNILSIAMLGIGVTPLVRRLGVDRSLAVLPGMIALAGAGVLMGGALAATVFLKAADGTLRYSLHKTATELLYLPMASSLRTAVKGTIDIVGQAGAKALASVIILALALLPNTTVVIAAATVVAALTWVLLALRLRHSYLNVFRETLNEGMIETSIDHPELDLESAASLIRALSDTDERRAIASMRIMTERGHVALIPTLILYHPSAKVVVHALDTFALARKHDLMNLLDHLLEHENGDVRGAAVRAAWMLEPSVEVLSRFENHDCLAIRVSAGAGALALGAAGPGELDELLKASLAYESYEPRFAAAVAGQLHYHPIYRETLLTLCRDANAEVATEAARAICMSDDAWFTGPTIELLDDRRTRDILRGALISHGDAALEVLAAALVHPATPTSALRHIPRTIARFNSAEAANVLIEGLSKVDNGMVRFKLLRGLETLLLGRGHVNDEEMRITSGVNTAGIRTELDRTIKRSLELLHLERELERGQTQDSKRITVGGELLTELLRDKHELAKGRLLILLSLLYPMEDFRVIRSGLDSSDATEQASAAELIETLVSREIGTAILGLAMSGSAAERLTAADGSKKHPQLTYAVTLQALLEDDSESVRAVTLYHTGEICFDCSADELPQMIQDEMTNSQETGQSLQSRAARMLRDLSQKSRRLSLPVALSMLVK